MHTQKALITGGSRGVGAATAVALAEQGFDCAITCRNKENRARQVAEQIRNLGRSALTLTGDLTIPEERERLFDNFTAWSPTLNALILNASGGLETGKPANYPHQINHDAQIGLLDLFKPRLATGASLVFVTSHWAHLFGQIEQLPHYEPVAESKFRGEQAVRSRQAELAEAGVRLLVVTGDVVDGTITAKLLERKQPGLLDARRDSAGELITAEDMGSAIAHAVMDKSLPTGHTVVVGSPLESLA